MTICLNSVECLFFYSFIGLLVSLFNQFFLGKIVSVLLQNLKIIKMPLWNSPLLECHFKNILIVKTPPMISIFNYTHPLSIPLANVCFMSYLDPGKYYRPKIRIVSGAPRTFVFHEIWCHHTFDLENFLIISLFSCYAAVFIYIIIGACLFK
jgi:hypothetical protein